jgi:hypothetical protein
MKAAESPSQEELDDLYMYKNCEPLFEEVKEFLKYP